jgi:GNAT superfamily N-acetyltransferase
MVELRPFKRQDLDSLYAISLATGLAGGDASALYQDGRMIGHIYSAPYALLSPTTSFVAQDSEGVAGYIVGALDTPAFEERLEREWWPGLRAIYRDPGGDPPSAWSADQRRSFMIHHPRRTPAAISELFPSHLHMNLLPRMQGRGVGRSLLELWLGTARAMGATSVHVVPNSQNQRAIRFWETCGFDRLAAHPATPADSRIWLGRHLDGHARASA